MRLSVEAAVALDYYSLRETDAERAVLDSTIERTTAGPGRDDQSLPLRA